MRKIPIFMYHHVENYRPETPLKSLFVSPDTFRKQMRLMHFLGYEGKSMAELLPYLRGETSGKVFGITFDDGYRDNLQNALPVLKQYGFSSTCYVVSDAIGGENHWDAKHQDPHRLMTLDELKIWLASGQDVGVHTASHADLATLPVSDYPREIRQARAFLQAALGVEPIDHFCYPFGHLNDSVVSFLSQSGFVTATTTERRLAEVSEPLLTLPRLFMKDNMGLIKTFLKITFG